MREGLEGKVEGGLISYLTCDLVLLGVLGFARPAPGVAASL